MKKQVQFNLRRTADVGRADVTVKIYDDSLVVSAGVTGDSKTFPYIPGTPYITYLEQITSYLQNMVFDEIGIIKNELLTKINDAYLADKSSFNDKMVEAIQESFDFPP